MAVVVTLPWTRQRWAWPLRCVLATTPDVSEQRGKRHQTGGMRAPQMVRLRRRWLPHVPLTLRGETASRLLERGWHGVAQRVTLLAPFRLDAVIHHPPEVRTTHTMGRPRVGGKRWPSLETVWQDPKTMWQRLTVDGSGEGQRVGEICTATALWSRSGSDPLPIRWVRTRDPEGTRPPQALFSTDHSHTAEEMVLAFLKRWRVETTFEERHAHVGIETPRPWSDLASERTTPLLFGLDRLVTIFGHALHPDGPLPLKQAAWSHQQAATVREVLAVVRRHRWDHCSFHPSPTDPEVVFVPSSTLSRLASAVCS